MDEELRLYIRFPFVLLVGFMTCALVSGQDAPWPGVRVGKQSPGAKPAAPATPEQVAERLRALEETNRKLSLELEKDKKDYGEQMKQLLEQYRELKQRLDAEDAPATDPNSTASGASTGSPAPSYTEGQSTVHTPPPGYPETNIFSGTRFPLKATFGPGFQLLSKNEQFRLRFRYESQIEGRAWNNSDQIPANSGFFLPRQRIFFDGHITEPVEYEISINRGVNNINILNAYLNFHFDDRLQLRMGRFFTPFTYEQFAISNYWLLAPERSLFTTNLSPNRQIGVLGWGYLFDKQLDYAAGVFNGSRNSFENLDNEMEMVGFVNVRPFQESSSFEFLRLLNLGTSVAYGRHEQTPVPPTFRVGAGSPDTNIPSIATVPFLILNRNVAEDGNRLLGSVHAAYFYQSLSLIGEWQYGYGNYSSPAHTGAIQVPFNGAYLAAGYFLTGEEIVRRTRLKPLRPFIPLDKNEARGPGAWEVVGRVSHLGLGDEIFSDGLADRALWSNSATSTEVGLNWYLNEYLKVYMFWLHAEFGKPVQYRPGGLQNSADMLWFRTQLYF